MARNHFRNDVTELDLCFGRYSCSNGKLGHQKDVRGGRGGEKKTVKLEAWIIHSYTLKTTRVKTKAKIPKGVFACSS